MGKQEGLKSELDSERNQKSSLMADIFKVFSSQIVVILLGLVNGFIVPKWLGVSGYADYKTFLLYAGLVGILHFGFADGVYLKYGGVQPKNIDIKDLYEEFLFLLFFQILISLPFVFFALLFDDPFLIPLALIIIPTNLITFFVFLYQATGRFTEYARYNILRPVLRLLLVLGVLFVVGSQNIWLLIWGQVLINWIMVLGLLRFSKLPFTSFSPIRIFKNTKHWAHIQVGCFIMLGNLSGLLFYSMDRWFVKFFLSKADFAYYSFAVSMMGLVLILISAVSMTFYPVLSRNLGQSNVVGPMRDKILVLGAFSAGAFFPFALIVDWFLPEYRDSLRVISFLFAGLPAISVINVIYVNSYKAAKLERKYFFQVLSMVFCSCLLNVIAITFYPSVEMIAVASTVGFYLWFFSYPKFQKDSRPTIKIIAFVFLFLLNFFITTIFFPSSIGMVIFFAVQIILSWGIFNEVFVWLFKMMNTIFLTLKKSVSV
jgi:O-antigen/teichoic acid export membrane protein